MVGYLKKRTMSSLEKKIRKHMHLSGQDSDQKCVGPKCKNRGNTQFLNWLPGFKIGEISHQY